MELLRPDRQYNELSFFNADNMAVMGQYPDGYFDLAIVDPPYGINVANMRMGVGKGKKTSSAKHRKWINKDWDSEVPKSEYWSEVFRVSKNQIIWGGNYFDIGPCKHYVIWDKQMPDGLSFSDCEFAWTSYNMAQRIFRYSAYLDKASKMHPTQKPIPLYEWLLKNYAKQGQKILDTHLGSNSIGIAIHKANELDDMRLSFVGCEIDKDYFDRSMRRFEWHRAQQFMKF